MNNYIKRFWIKVQMSSDEDECWPWLANKHRQGYGFFKYRNQNLLAHRIAYAIANSLDIIDLILNPQIKVIHTCDNPPCCNPKHLKLGTQADNIKDMIKKGRRGLCNSKLTREEVEAIRNDSRSNKELALIYGMTENGIYYARTGRNWINQEPGPQEARFE